MVLSNTGDWFNPEDGSSIQMPFKLGKTSITLTKDFFVSGTSNDKLTIYEKDIIPNNINPGTQIAQISNLGGGKRLTPSDYNNDRVSFSYTEGMSQDNAQFITITINSITTKFIYLKYE